MSSVGQTILTLILAVSVAMLPIAGTAGHSSQSSETVDMSVSADTSTAQGMPDCCPPGAVPCDKANSNSMSMVGCVGICCGFLVSIASPLMISLVEVEMLRAGVSAVLCSESTTPPFRPPRVQCLN